MNTINTLPQDKDRFTNEDFVRILEWLLHEDGRIPEPMSTRAITGILNELHLHLETDDSIGFFEALKNTLTGIYGSGLFGDLEEERTTMLIRIDSIRASKITEPFKKKVNAIFEEIKQGKKLSMDASIV